MRTMRATSIGAFIVVIIGALNWAAVGVSGTNVVEELVGTGGAATTAFAVVGIAALLSLPLLAWTSTMLRRLRGAGRLAASAALLTSLLAALGAFNWGLVAVFDANLVTAVFTDASVVDFVYGLLGAAAVLSVPSLLATWTASQSTADAPANVRELAGERATEQPQEQQRNAA